MKNGEWKCPCSASSWFSCLVLVFYCSGQKAWLFQLPSFKLPSLNNSGFCSITCSSSWWLPKTSLHSHTTSRCFFPSDKWWEKHLSERCVVGSWRVFIPLDAAISLKKKFQTLSPEHPQSLWKIWSPSRNLNSLNSKAKAGSPSSAGVSALPWAFHQLLKCVVIVTCTLSALGSGLWPRRTIHHTWLCHVVPTAFERNETAELILPLTWADRNGGLQMGSQRAVLSTGAPPHSDLPFLGKTLDPWGVS